MAAKEEMTLWTGYFDTRLSRSDGRRVPREASIPKPTLESLVWAARSAGIRKMRQEPEASHPSRPYAKEGRLIMPPRHVLEVTGESSKEGVMKAIGTALRKRSQDAKEQGKDTAARSPAKGDRRRRAQRKSFKHRKSGQRKKKFGRK